MKAIEVSFALLVFNVCMSLVVHAGLTEYPPYYESEYITAFSEEGELPEDISTISESQQYSTSMNIFNVIASVIAFDWLYMLIPDALDVYAMPFIIGLDAVMAFFVGLALIEIFVRRADLLGSSTKS